MRHSRVLAFERAVLVLLSLPAGCGGRSETFVRSPDGGLVLSDSSTGASCGWTAPPSPSPPAQCSWLTNFTGDSLECAGFPAGPGTAAQCLAICGRNNNGQAPDICIVTAGTPNTLSCDVTSGSCAPTIFPGNGGRRPDYFASLGFGPAPKGRELGTHFARVACMEAGSVEAFRRLRDDLRIHGAPVRLVRAASRAMRDEIRHVRQTSALARRFGEEPIAPLPAMGRGRRTLEAVALENAVEGCVRETYSALECLWQAHRAEDPLVRSTMVRIARDEMRHLALSWEVHAWAMSRLGAAPRERLRAAQQADIAVLAGEMTRDPVPSLVGVGGLPRAVESRALVDVIAGELRAA